MNNEIFEVIKEQSTECSYTFCFTDEGINTKTCIHDSHLTVHHRPQQLSSRLVSRSRNISAYEILQIILALEKRNDNQAIFRSIVIHGAIVHGRLNLDDSELRHPLSFIACHLPSGISATRSRIQSLNFENCIVGSSWDNILQSTLDFEDTTFNDGASFPGTIITNNRGSALNFSGSIIPNDLKLNNGFEAVGNGSEPTIKLLGAKIGGQLNLINSSVKNDPGPAISADRMTVENSVIIRGTFTNSGIEQRGVIRLVGAKIAGQLSFSGSKVVSEHGPALMADRLTVLDSILCTGPSNFSGSGINGVIRLSGALINGHVNIKGPTAIDSTAQFRIVNSSGPAILASNSNIKLNFQLENGVIVEGASPSGAIQLSNSIVAGQLSIVDSCISNYCGPAVCGVNLKVGSNLHIRGCQDTNEHVNLQSVVINGAKIEGNFKLEAMLYENSNSLILEAPNLVVGQEMTIDLTIESMPTTKFAAFNLENAKVGSGLHVSESCIDAAQFGVHWMVDGMTYAGCPKISGSYLADARKWREFITSGTDKYSAQPFRYFASQLVSSGHYMEAHKVLIQQRRSRSKLLTNPFRQMIDWVLWRAIGYGYQTWRALFCLLALLIIACISICSIGNGTGVGSPSAHQLFILETNSQTQETSTNNSQNISPVPALQKLSQGLVSENTSLGLPVNSDIDPSNSCSFHQKIFLAVDASVPFVSTGVNESCKVRLGTIAGDSVGSILLLVKIFSWGLTALFIAGFTSIVRKD